MHPALKILLKKGGLQGSGTGGALPRWSVVFAAAGVGDALTVGSSSSLLFDMPLGSCPKYGDIVINGSIVVDQTIDTEFAFDSLDVNGGSYICGTEASPFPRARTHKITPSGARSLESSGNLSTPATASISKNRGIYFRNGAIQSWVAAVPSVTVAKLAATANIGDTSLHVAVPMTLSAGDQLILTTTKYWHEGLTDLQSATDSVLRRPGYGQEIVTVASNVTAGTTIPLTAALTAMHWGALQYLVPPAHEDVAGTNLSLTPYTILNGDSFGTVNSVTVSGTRVNAAITAGASNVIDNRATVGLITHPIKIAAPADTDWTSHGYGASVMGMGLTTIRRRQGIMFDRCGKAGQLGAYPDHEHVRSYTPYGSAGSGTYLGDVTIANNYMRSCSISNSSNRGFTFHGTCGVELSSSVMVNCDTHNIFLEDGSEERNIIDGNLVAGVGEIGYGATPIKVHDYKGYPPDNSPPHPPNNVSGPAGIWYTNPQNYLRNNIVSGAYVGIWNTMSTLCHGQTRDATIQPCYLDALQWYNNEAHSCRFFNMRSIDNVVDELGNFGALQFWGGPENSTVISGVDRHLQKANLWKTSYQWYFNRVKGAHYHQWTVSGLPQANTTIFENQPGVIGVANGMFDGCVFAAHTLDDPYQTQKTPLMTSYHNNIARQNSIFIPSAMGTMAKYSLDKLFSQGGSLALWDYYEDPVELLFTLDTGTVFLGANPGFPGVMFPPYYELGTFAAGYATAIGGISAAPISSRGQAAAYKLPSDGTFFGQSGGWWCYDSPFTLYGINPTDKVYAQAPSGLTNLNGVLLPSTYNFVGLWALAASGNDVTGETDGNTAHGYAVNYTRYDSTFTTSQGTWNTPKASTLSPPDVNYYNKRHACILDQGCVDTTWPNRTDVPLPTSLYLQTWGMVYSLTGYVIWRLDWNGSTAVTSASCSNRSLSSLTFTSAPNFSTLAASSTPRYWVDAVNNKIYLKIFPPSLVNTNGQATDDIAYRTHNPIDIHIN